MKKRKWPRFARFSLVGLLGVGLQLSLLTLLTKHFRLPPTAAAALAVEMTVIHNFLWHERFTWAGRQNTELRQRSRRLWRFHLSNGLVSLLGNTLLTYCFVERLKVKPLPSSLLAIGICSLANYALADRWVYEYAKSEFSGDQQNKCARQNCPLRSALVSKINRYSR